MCRLENFTVCSGSYEKNTFLKIKKFHILNPKNS